jgi:hypothetical protein
MATPALAVAPTMSARSRVIPSRVVVMGSFFTGESLKKFGRFYPRRE